MGVVKGCDSAGEPNAAQIMAAKAQGFGFFAFYVAGPGATHNWSSAGIAAVKNGGLAPLPIYVPAMDGNGYIASTTPTADAAAFVGAYKALGIDGAGVLDTEASMRGDPAWTASYTEQFCAELRALGQSDICYAGGFSLSNPPAATYKWWIIAADIPVPATCYQAWPGNIAGLDVDVDFADAAFPLAQFATGPSIAPLGDTAMYVRNNGAAFQVTHGTTTVTVNEGDICLCDTGGAVKFDDNHWSSVVAAYRAVGAPLPLIQDAVLLAQFCAIGFTVLGG